MNLLQVKQYFKSIPMANTVDVARHFDTTPSHIQCYIEHWHLRGQLIKCKEISACMKGCAGCKPPTLTYYAWQATTPLKAAQSQKHD